MSLMRCILVVAAAFCCGCGGPTPTPAPPAATAPPFDAAAIRSATAPGRTYVHRAMPGGGAAVVMRTRFVQVDDVQATIEVTTLGPNGQPMGRTRSSTLTWAALESHGVPQPGTVRTEGPCVVPAGRFQCIFHEVETVDGRKRDGFARSLPGMPVVSEVQRGGRWVPVMVLVEHTPGG